MATEWTGKSSRFDWNFTPEEIAKRKGLTRAFYKDVADMLIQYYEPYVPYWRGDLSAYVQGFGAADHATVTYQRPYANKHYHGTGIDESKRCRLFHPLATSYWDKAAWNNSGERMTAEINLIRKKHAIK